MPSLSAELELGQELFSRSVRARASNESNFENQPQFGNENVTEETKFHNFAQAEDNSSDSKKAMDPSMLKYFLYTHLGYPLNDFVKIQLSPFSGGGGCSQPPDKPKLF